MLTQLHRVIEGHRLTTEEAENAMLSILSGEATTAQIAALLTALRLRGESVEEIVGLARAMRAKSTKVDGGDGLILDTCGTGGDGLGTINISTIAAFVVAGVGVRVAKHGNRSVSGKFGSADLMEALGVRIGMSPEDMGRAIRDAGIAFLFAPALHPAMKHAAPARQELKMRTVFNLLGPLTNPAGAQVQIVGAPSTRVAELLAAAMQQLGIRGFVVHSGDGLDEITTTASTKVWPIGGEPFELSPTDFGIALARIEDLQGDPVAAAQSVLKGDPGAARDIVLVNAAAALVAAGVARDWRDGVAQAAKSIDSGEARARLDALRSV